MWLERHLKFERGVAGWLAVLHSWPLTSRRSSQAMWTAIGYTPRSVRIYSAKWMRSWKREWLSSSCKERLRGFMFPPSRNMAKRFVWIAPVLYWPLLRMNVASFQSCPVGAHAFFYKYRNNFVISALLWLYTMLPTWIKNQQKQTKRKSSRKKIQAILRRECYKTETHLIIAAQTTV